MNGVRQEMVEGEKPIFVEAIEDVIAERQAEAHEQHKDFKATIDEFNAAIRPLKTQWSELRNHVIETKKAAVAFETAPERKAALRGFAEAATDPVEKARRLAEAEAVAEEEVDFSDRASLLYESVAAHTAASKQLQEQVSTTLETLPSRATSEAATEALEACSRGAAGLSRLPGTATGAPEHLEARRELFGTPLRVRVLRWH